MNKVPESHEKLINSSTAWTVVCIHYLHAVIRLCQSYQTEFDRTSKHITNRIQFMETQQNALLHELSRSVAEINQYIMLNRMTLASILQN